MTTSQTTPRGLLASLFLGTAVFITAVLVARLRVATEPLAAGWVFVVAIFVGALAVVGTRCLLTAEATPPSLRMKILATLLASGITCTAIMTVASLGSAAAFTGGCLSSLLLFAGSLWLTLGKEIPNYAALRNFFRRTASSARAESPISTADVTSEPPVPRDSNPVTENVEQSWKRWNEGGHDILEGCVRVRFDAGQATAIVHIPLQPAMSTTPVVEVEPVEDSDIRVSADPVLPYGVRLTCRRSANLSEPYTTEVAVQISGRPAQARAA